MPSVHLDTGEAVEAHFERSDVCAVPAAGVVAEAMVRWTLASALLDKLGGDSLAEVRDHFRTLSSETERQ
ncbi:Chorismate synthase [compost metagenome]